jgi:hypothetical protein
MAAKTPPNVPVTVADLLRYRLIALTLRPHLEALTVQKRARSGG